MERLQSCSYGCQCTDYLFRNEKSGDILVKVMHNENEVHIPVETDMFPYYKWEDVERFYRNLLN